MFFCLFFFLGETKLTSEKKNLLIFALSLSLSPRVLAGIFDMLKLHYPERLDAFWFLNAPTIFWALWRVVGPMVRK